MPEIWSWSDLIPMYKGGGEVRSGVNYKSVKFLERSMKVIEKWLRNVVRIDEIRMGFMP